VGALQQEAEEAPQRRFVGGYKVDRELSSVGGGHHPSVR
jgi:hypothetical protein